MTSPRVFLAEADVNRLYPYYVLLDRQLRIAGGGARWNTGDWTLPQGEAWSEVFILTPRLAAETFESLRDLPDASVARRRDGLPLRGAFCAVPQSEYLLFLCSPSITNLDDITRFGLTFADLSDPQQSTAVDLLFLLQNQRRTLRDARALQAQLTTTEQRFAHAMRAVTDGIHVLDSSGNVVLANPAFADSLGYTLEEVLHLRIQDWETALAPEEIPQVLARLFASSSPSTFETRHRRKDGSICEVEVQVRVATLDGRPALYASSRDITARKASDERLRTALAHAERASARQEQLLRMLSVQVRTPLSHVVNAIELALPAIVAQTTRGLVLTALRSAEDIAALVDEVLAVARVTDPVASIQGQRFSPRNLLEDVCEWLQSSLPGAPVATLNVATDLPPVAFGDRSAITSVLRSLLRYVAESGPATQLVLGLAARPATSRSATYTFRVGGRSQRFDVEEVAGVFTDATTEPLSAGRLSGSPGVSLRRAMMLAQASGGSLTLERVSRTRVRFQFTITLTSGDEERRKSQPVAFDRRITSLVSRPLGVLDDFEHVRALVVDDNVVSRQLLASMLTRLRCRVLEAGSGAAALTLMKTQVFDAVFLDIVMQGLDGFETAVRARGLGPGAPTLIVGVSAARDAAAVKRAQDAGMLNLLAKPVGEHDLVQVLRLLAPREQGRAPATPGAANVLSGHHPDMERVEAVLARLGSSRGAVTAAFIANASAHADTLRRDDIAWPELRTLLHDLKGSADVLNMSLLSDAIAALQTCNSGDLADSERAERCRTIARAADDAVALCEWLHRRATHLRHFVQESVAAIVVNADGRIVEANRSMAALSGYEKSDLLGAPVEMLVPDRAAHAHQRHRAEFAALPIARSMKDGGDLDLKRKDGTGCRVAISLSPINVLGEALTVARVVDLTEQLERDRAKRHYLEQIGHEMRAPLQTVLGMSELLAGTPLSPDQLQLLRPVLTATKALRAVIGDLLDLDAIESDADVSVQKESFDPWTLVEEVAELGESFGVAKGVHVIPVVSCDLPRALRGDAIRLRQVAINLVSNAAKYTDDGEIVLEAGLRVRDGLSPVFEVHVKDTGCGIPLEEQSRLFERYFRASTGKERRGTGVGLFLSRALAGRMGGVLELASSSPSGSDFLLAVPVESVPGDLSARPVSPGLRIVVASPSAAVRASLTAHLERAGHRVEQWSGDDTGAIGDDVDVVLEDYRCPPIAASARSRVIGLKPIWSTGRANWNHALNLPPRVDDVLTAVKGRSPEIASRDCIDAKSADTPKAAIDVLIVDDDPSALQWASAVMSGAGHRVTTAASGAEALAKVHDRRYGVILLDHDMPDMLGVDVARTIIETDRSRFQEDVPIVACTADARPVTRAACLAVGMVTCLTKPTSTQEILRTVRERADVRPTLLVVDDAVEIQLLVRRALPGIRTIPAFTLADVRDALRRESPAAAIIDLQIGDVSGPEALALIRSNARGAALPVLAMSGLHREDSRQAMLDEGCAGFLMKPLEPRALVDAVLRCMTATPEVQSSHTSAVGVAGWDGVDDLVPKFLMTVAKELERAESALADRRLADVQAIGHRLKGTGTSYGFPDITVRGGELESAAKGAAMQDASVALQALGDCVRAAMQRLDIRPDPS